MTALAPDDDPVPEVTRSARLDSLTGLRALAALAVFASHVGPLFGGEPLLTIAGKRVTASMVTSQGNVGVSFFFILSGFVLSWSARPEGDPKRAFYGRRFARIYPLHVVTLAAWIALVAVGALHLADWWTALISLVLLQAWMPVFQLLGPIQPNHSGNQAVYATPNRPSWSLSCEAFFYALFPFIHRRMSRLSPTAGTPMFLILGAMAMAVPVCLWLAKPAIGKEAADYLGYAFPPVRLLEFLAGMALAKVVASGRWRRIPLGWALAAAAVAYLIARWIPRPISFVAVTLLPFVLVIAAATSRDLAHRKTFWSHRIARYAGEISFAFYLSQSTVIDLVSRYWPRGAPSIARAVTMTAAALVTTAAVSMTLHHAVERPCERWLRARIGHSKAPRANDVPIRSNLADPKEILDDTPQAPPQTDESRAP